MVVGRFGRGDVGWGGDADRDRHGHSVGDGDGVAVDTAFDLDLPTGAVCSLAGGAGGTYVTFLVPADATLAALTDTDNSEADAIGVLDQGVALSRESGFVSFDGSANTPPGGISTSDTADFEMAYLVTTDHLTVGSGTQLPLPGTALIPTGATSADYEAGLACFNNNNNTETDYWSVPVTFNLASSDPNGFTWTIGAASNPGTTTTTVAGETTTTVVGETTTTVVGETTTTVAGETTTTVVETASTATHLVVTAPTSATTGTSFTFTVSAEDASNEVVSGYTDPVAITSSDTAASLPASSALTDGTGTFTITLNTVGDQTITATDTTTSTITGASAAIDVTTSTTVTHLVVTAPTSATADTSFTFTVDAENASDAVVPGYADEVAFTSTAAAEPAVHVDTH